MQTAGVDMVDTQAERELFIVEYDKLKTEQVQRIGFRDNLLFVQLTAIGAVASWVLTNLEKPSAIHALLVVPWVCVILGWTYIVNDHHISRIGKYVREVMNQRATILVHLNDIEVCEADGRGFTLSEVFGWEVYHRIDKNRVPRKLMQLVIDQGTFLAPGIVAVLAYTELYPNPIKGWLIYLITLESLCLTLLFLGIVDHANLKRGK